jgi:hypothetical protein
LETVIYCSYSQIVGPNKRWRVGLTHSFRDSLASWESHSLEPFIDFLRHVAQFSKGTCEAILEAGVDEPICDQCSRLSCRDRAGRTSSNVSPLCRIQHFTSYSHDWKIISGHPCYILWTTHPHLPTIHRIQNRQTERVTVWHSVEREHIPYLI